MVTDFLTDVEDLLKIAASVKQEGNKLGLMMLTLWANAGGEVKSKEGIS